MTNLGNHEIPGSELRAQLPPSDKKKVCWVSGVPDGAAARFLFYITRACEIDPGSLTGPPASRHLFSLRLHNGRWFVCFVEIISLVAAYIEHGLLELCLTEATIKYAVQ